MNVDEIIAHLNEIIDYNDQTDDTEHALYKSIEYLKTLPTDGAGKLVKPGDKLYHICSGTGKKYETTIKSLYFSSDQTEIVVHDENGDQLNMLAWYLDEDDAISRKANNDGTS